MISLRPYQAEAKAAFYRHLELKDNNPCIVIPTAGGKTPLLASICSDVHSIWNGRILILAHVRELLTQAKDKIAATDPTLPVGIYSAGLNSRDKTKPITIAGIQSIYNRACEFDPFDLILVDEAHRLPSSGEGMYRTFLDEAKQVNPYVRLGGLTATPYRLDVGSICHRDHLLNEICYEVSVKELIRDGYICRVKSRSGSVQADMTQVHVRGGEFKADDMAAAFDQPSLVKAACEEIVSLTADRKGILIFCCSVEHAEHVVETLKPMGVGEVGFVCGDTPSEMRTRTLEDFKVQKIRVMVNVNVLTEGFDATHVDCVVLLRATLSPGLFYQMVGRGFRLHPGKDYCAVLDFGGNALRHGPVDAIKTKKSSGGGGGGAAPQKECPGCRYLIPAGCVYCPECSFHMPRESTENPHDQRSGNAPILSGEKTSTEWEVKNVVYTVHQKKGTQPGDAPPTMRVNYEIGFHKFQSEWVCVEHTGYARNKAKIWWDRRTTIPMPESVTDAVTLAKAGCLTAPTHITVEEVSGEKFARIVGYKLGEKFSPGDSFEMPILDKKSTSLSDDPFEIDAQDVAELATSESEIPW